MEDHRATGPGQHGDPLAHQLALDGVRALAVSAVVLFHAGVPGFGGGYLGVDTVFVLSGFLVTSLLPAGSRSAPSGCVALAGNCPPTC